jgi:hypothetical protein
MQINFKYWRRETGKTLISLTILLLLTSAIWAQQKDKPKEELDLSDIKPIRLSSLRLDWMPIMATDDEIFFLHKKRIRTKQNTVKVWVSKDPIKRDRGSRSITSFEINCNQELMRIRAIVWYKPDGKVLTSDTEIQKWEDIIPDTLGDKILAQVCKNNSSKARH